MEGVPRDPPTLEGDFSGGGEIRPGGKGGASDTIKTVVQRVVIDGKEPMSLSRHDWKRRRTCFVRWEFTRLGRQRSIELEHGSIFGRRRISVDGTRVLDERVIFDAGSSYRFVLGGLTIRVLIMSAPSGYHYEILFNQSKPFTDRRLEGETTFTFASAPGACPDSP